MDARENELLRVLELARQRTGQQGERPPGAMTRRELQKELELTTPQTLELLNELKDQGLIEVVEITGINLANRRQQYPAYMLKEGWQEEWGEQNDEGGR